jgi:gluconokinase
MIPQLSVQPRALILMGVAGCGKTAVGELLARRLNFPFFDGDNYHPENNIAKMAAGIPLDDQDRIPWLTNLHDIISKHLQAGKSLILACSALKQAYRDQLAAGNPELVFIYLKGDFDLIYRRMQERQDHYMRPEMLRSQFDALEEPVDALTIDVDQSLEAICEQIISHCYSDEYFKVKLNE